MSINSLARISAGCVLLALAAGTSAQTYQVAGGIDHACVPADFTKQCDSGVSAAGVQLNESHSSPDDLGSAQFSGSASGNSLHAFAKADASASLLSHADAGVFATLTESVRFIGGADGSVAVRVGMS